MSKSVSHTRKVSIYPSPVMHKLLLAESELTEISRSSIMTEALKQYYDRMPESEKRRLLETLK